MTNAASNKTAPPSDPGRYFTPSGELTFDGKEFYLRAWQNGKIESVPSAILDYIESHPETVAELILHLEIHEKVRPTDNPNRARGQGQSLVRRSRKTTVLAAVGFVSIAMIGALIWFIWPRTEPSVSRELALDTTNPAKMPVDSQSTTILSTDKPAKEKPETVNGDLALAEAYRVNDFYEREIRRVDRDADRLELAIYAPDTLAYSAKSETPVKIQFNQTGEYSLRFYTNKQELVAEKTFSKELNEVLTLPDFGLYYWQVVDETNLKVLRTGKCRLVRAK